MIAFRPIVTLSALAFALALASSALALPGPVIGLGAGGASAPVSRAPSARSEALPTPTGVRTPFRHARRCSSTPATGLCQINFPPAGANQILEIDNVSCLT